MRHHCRLTVFNLACVVILLSARSPAAERPANISFRNDVMAVLSKSGCNAGVCHGNANGKGGFKLSLRGDDPAADFAALSHSQSGRRTNLLQPDQSLILLKPTMQVAHEGGRRFAEDTEEYRILHDWIAGGMPRDAAGTRQLAELRVTPIESYLVEPESRMSLHAEADYSDGSTRDVTGLAVYEPSTQSIAVSSGGVVERREFGESTVVVRYLNRQVPVRLAFIPRRSTFEFHAPLPANFVDEHVFAKLKKLQINPSPVADDTVFLRRVSLDLLGLVPTADEAKEFAVDANPAKRAELVDRFLKRQEFADFWALKWADLLRIEEKTLDRKGVQNFHAWIRDAIAHGKPLDQFARELISARGSTYTNPAANFYRAMRDPLMRGESTAQVFLGVRLQCVRCHNHPFDQWTQDDYYGWANNFSRVSYKVLQNDRRDSNDSHEFDGEQVVYMAGKGDVKNPRLGRPTPPRYLDGGSAGPAKGDDRLMQLADWVASPRNDRFVKTQVNRIWFHLMGRGIVDPIDDFRSTNPAVNPELLGALADEFVAAKFDMRHLIRVITQSKTYQLSFLPNETNAADETNFSHANRRPLAAEQLLDSISRVTGVPAQFNGYPVGTRAGEIPGVQALRARDVPPDSGDRFLTMFGKPERLQACECERTSEATLIQALQLLNGNLMVNMLADQNGKIEQMLAANDSTATIVDEFFWRALSRAATDEERKQIAARIDAATDRRAGVQDFVWALIQSAEFQSRF